MSGFGERLRRQREMRGVSLEEISKSTKIGTRSLKAIEDEDFEKLPGGIFNKGFVRAYARFLGLDEEQIVGDFEEAWNAYEDARTPQVLVVPEQEEKKSSSGPLWVTVVLLIVITAAAAGWYRYQRMRNQVAAPSSSEPDSPSSVPASSENPPSSEPQATAPAPAPVQNGTDSRGSQSSHASQTETAPQGPKVTASGTPSAAGSKLIPTPATKPEGSAPIRLQVFAREDSWLSVSADGKDLGQGILAAQKTRSIRARKEVRLKIGNLAGIEVSFNGQRVDVDGQPRQVKELIFTAAGLQQ